MSTKDNSTASNLAQGINISNQMSNWKISIVPKSTTGSYAKTDKYINPRTLRF
jgi:hypothetical protein